MLNRSFDGLSSGQNVSSRGNKLNMSMQANEIKIARDSGECTAGEDYSIISSCSGNRLEGAVTNQVIYIIDTSFLIMFCYVLIVNYHQMHR